MSEAKGHEVDERIQQYRSIVEQDPASPLFVPLAEAYLSAGNPAEALEVCRGGLAFLPDLADGRLVLAKALCRLGRLREAEAELAALVALAPELEEPQELLAQLRAGQLVTVDIRRADIPPAPQEELSVSLEFGEDDLEGQTRHDVPAALIKGGEKEGYELQNVLPTLEFRSQEEADAHMATLRRTPSIKRDVLQEESPPPPLSESGEEPPKSLEISVELSFDEGENEDETRPLIDLTPPTEAGLSWEERSKLIKEEQGGLAELFDPGLPRANKSALSEESAKDAAPEKKLDIEIPLPSSLGKKEEGAGGAAPAEEAPKRRRTQLLQRKSPDSPLTPIEKLAQVPVLPLSEPQRVATPAPPLSPLSPSSLPAASRGAPIEIVPQEDDDERMTELAVRSNPSPATPPPARRQVSVLPPFPKPPGLPPVPSPPRPLPAAQEMVESGVAGGPVLLSPGLDTPLSPKPREGVLAALKGRLNWRFLVLGGSLAAVLILALVILFWLRNARHAREALALLASSEVLLADGSYAGLQSAAGVLEDAAGLRPEHGPILSRIALVEGLRVLIFQEEERSQALADALEELRAISYQDEGVIFGQTVLTARLDIELALKEVQEGRLRHPESGYLAFLEGELLWQRGDLTGAGALWEKALALSPGLSWARLALAASEVSARSGRDALSLVKEELSARPGQPRALALALLLQEKGEAASLPKVGDLSSQLQKILSSASLDETEAEWIRVALLRRAYLNGEEEACDNWLESLLGGDGPREPEVRFLLGELLLARGQNQEAERVLSPLVGRFSEERLLPLLSEALLSVGKLADAEAYLARLPLTAHTRYLKGRALWARGDLGGAERELRKALEEEPGLAAAKLYLAQVLLTRKDASKAKTLLSSSALSGLPPRLLPAPYSRAMPRLLEAEGWVLLGKREEAGRALSQARAIAPRDEAVARTSERLGISLGGVTP